MTMTAASRYAEQPAFGAADADQAHDPLGNPRPALEQVVDRTRAEGHVVHVHYAVEFDPKDLELVTGAEEFLHQVLAPSNVSSRRAYVRLYQSKSSLFAEVTQLSPSSFDDITKRMSVRSMIETVGQWATAHQHALSVRRGPRDRLRLAVMLRPTPTVRT